MKLITTYFGPSSVSHSIKCRLSPDPVLEHLVLAKSNVIEIYGIQPEGLILEKSQDLWGRISSIHSIHSRAAGLDRLVVAIDHPDPRVILFELSSSSQELHCLKVVSLTEKFARPAEFLNGLIIDHSETVLVASAYVGKLKVINLDDGDFQSDFDLTVRELNILSACFLRTPANQPLCLALLHLNHSGQVVLISHDLLVEDQELSSASSLFPDTPLPLDTYLLIPVPPHNASRWNSSGGLLIFTRNSLFFYSNGRSRRRDDRRGFSDSVCELTFEWNMADVSAWTPVDEEGTRFLVGDSFGCLSMLAFETRSKTLDMLRLGEVSPPTSLTILPSQFLFVGSHFGDSQLVRISAYRDLSTKSHLEVVDQFTNIAPVLDAILCDTEGTGEKIAVTCSGGQNSGSLRVIRSGANFSVEAIVENIPFLTGIWPLRKSFGDSDHTLLVLSTSTSTFVAQIPERLDSDISLNVIPESQADGFSYRDRTIGVSNVLIRIPSSTGFNYDIRGTLVAQVLPERVNLVDLGLSSLASTWYPPDGRTIILADFSPTQLCVALSGGSIVLLVFEENKIVPLRQEDFSKVKTSDSNEISAISIGSAYTENLSSNYAAVGFYNDNEVRILSLPNFEIKSTICLASLAKSLCLYAFANRPSNDAIPHLFAGQVDGRVLSVPLQKGCIVMEEKRIFTIGNMPVTFTRCQTRKVLLACSKRSVLISWNEDRLAHSQLMIKDAIASSTISLTEEILVVATRSHLRFGRILEMKKSHVQTVQLHERVPVKIAYSQSANSFGLGCVATSAARYRDGASTFEIVDDSSFATIFTHSMDTNEEISAISTSEDSLIPQVSYFNVGTVYHSSTDSEAAKGRILVFSCQRKGDHSEPLVQVRLAVSYNAEGCVYAICPYEGMLLAAINTGVQILRLSREENDSLTLLRISDWNHNYLVTNIVSSNSNIIVGDAVNSLSILKFSENKLNTVARDYCSLWPITIESFDQNTIIGATCDNNLFSSDISLREEKVVLEHTGSYYFGENVNKIVTGHLAVGTEKEEIVAKQLIFTSSGRIAVLWTISRPLSLLLSRLSQNMDAIVRGVDNLEHHIYRTPANYKGRSDSQSEAYGFLDGDYLGKLLHQDVTPVELQKVIRGSTSAEQLQEVAILPALQALRECY